MKKTHCLYVLIIGIIMSAGMLSSCNTSPPISSANTDTVATVEDSVITEFYDETVSTSEDETIGMNEEIIGEKYVVPELPLPESNVLPEEVIKNIDPNATVYQFGVNTWQALLSDTDASEVKDIFVESGYTAVNVPTVEGAYNAPLILGAGNFMITIRQVDSSVRVEYDICDPYVFSLLFPTEVTGTGEVTMVQVGCNRIDETDNPGIGMCYIYKLSDGSALIVDGGTNSTADNIHAALQRMGIAKDESGRYRIAAWILTHAHGDHYGALINFTLFHATYSIDYVVYYFPLNVSGLGDIPVFVNWISQWFPNAIHVTPHAGLQYHFSNLTLDMLYTPDMLQNINYANDSSLVFVSDCSGARVLHMGDAGERAAETLKEAYKRLTFESDILQITHHGLVTGAGESHEWKNLRYIYMATKAKCAVLPMGTRSPVDDRNGRWTVINVWASMGFQTSYLTDKEATEKNMISSEADVYEEFVAAVAAGTAQYETLCGYNGINMIYNPKLKLTTYIMSSETENMATVFSLSKEGMSVVTNELLSEWLN